MHQTWQILKSLIFSSVCSFFRKCFGPRNQQIFDPISIILPQMDFLKDMTLVIHLITLLGGIVVFTNPQNFSSHVSKLIETLQYLLISLFLLIFHILDCLFATWNNLCSSIPWNFKLCCIKSSKSE